MSTELIVYLAGYVTMVLLLVCSYFRKRPSYNSRSDDAAAVIWSVMLGIGSWAFVAIFIYEVMVERKFGKQDEEL